VDAARIAVGLLLVAAAGGKLRVRGELPELLGAYGVPEPLRRPLAPALVGVEVLVGVLLLIGVDAAAYAALALGGIFVLAAVGARLRGFRRVRCGCFGADERPWALVLARALGFTGLAGLAAFGGGLDLGTVSRETVIFVALGVLAAAVVLLSLLVLALYRQVGVLSLRIGPRAPLELDEEGPPVGTPAPALGGLARRGGELVAFFSDDCRLCRELAPGVRALAREGVGVHVVYEGDDGAAFRRWNVPAAPFAVHVVDGVVAAKGLVNTLEQLDTLLAIGNARRAHAAA
jgi:Methylamine utilisation protein MauE